MSERCGHTYCCRQYPPCGSAACCVNNPKSEEEQGEAERVLEALAGNPEQEGYDVQWEHPVFGWTPVPLSVRWFFGLPGQGPLTLEQAKAVVVLSKRPARVVRNVIQVISAEK